MDPMKNAKKIALSGIVILAFVLYVAYEKTQTSHVSNISNSSNVSNTSDTSASKETLNPQTDASNSQQNLSTVTSSNYRDGTYTSSVADAFYGPLQIKVTIASGKISDVQFLQFPNDRPTSVEINTAAVPVLKQEAISSQKANVDIVSGATQTSEAFQVAMKEVLGKAS